MSFFFSFLLFLFPSGLSYSPTVSSFVPRLLRILVVFSLGKWEVADLLAGKYDQTKLIPRQSLCMFEDCYLCFPIKEPADVTGMSSICKLSWFWKLGFDACHDLPKLNHYPHQSCHTHFIAGCLYFLSSVLETILVTIPTGGPVCFLARHDAKNSKSSSVSKDLQARTYRNWLDTRCPSYIMITWPVNDATITRSFGCIIIFAVFQLFKANR